MHVRPGELRIPALPARRLRRATGALAATVVPPWSRRTRRQPRPVNVHGPPKLIDEGQGFPFIVVSPQCPEHQRWSVKTLDKLLNDIVAQYRIDEDRIYVTGLSLGGYGTWDLAARFPNRFAAIAPICGGEPSRACRFKHLPVWAFHGAQDEVAPLERSQEMVDALQQCGNDVRLTTYPDAGHNSWTETYDNPERYEWFLSPRRQAVEELE